MEAAGARRYLQPLLYVGVAVAAHALLFLVPVHFGQGPAGETTRGVRVRAVKEGPPEAARAGPVPPSRPAAPRLGETPGASSDKPFSSPGADSPGQGGAVGGPPGGSGGQGEPGAGQGAPPGDSAYASYLAKLRSEGVQGWARDSAGRAQQGWRGSGKTRGGWGTGSGNASGAGDGSGGTGSGKGGGGGYLDPRVRVVVTSYPPTEIERRHTQVPYPDLKVKQHQVTTGWWNVYIQLYTDKEGRIVRRTVLRPESDGPVEKMFVSQVQKEIDRWSFDRAEAEILVDVRFYVE